MKKMSYMNSDGNAAPNDPQTYRIIGLAIQVHTELGTGFVESVYHRALEIELDDAGISYRSAVPLEVRYKGRPAGNFFADMVIENRLLLELKACEAIASAHEVQVVNYLKATGFDLGLLLNFGSSTLQIKRKYRSVYPRPSELYLQEI